MTVHRILITFLLLLSMGSSKVLSVNYPQIFGDDWTQAAAFVSEHHAEWQLVFEDFGIDSRIAEAVVFPELIRYSYWQDAIESAAVKGAYVAGGSAKANFSIGRFQMKPSFAEEIDSEWNRSPLAREYGFQFDVRPISDARRSRIKRLDTLEGQCRYLAIFIRLMYQRHPQLQSLDAERQVRFLATAYNGDHTVTWAQNIKMQKQRRFHTALLKTRHVKTYRYCDISAAFYNNATKQHKLYRALSITTMPKK